MDFSGRQCTGLRKDIEPLARFGASIAHGCCSVFTSKLRLHVLALALRAEITPQSSRTQPSRASTDSNTLLPSALLHRQNTKGSGTV